MLFHTNNRPTNADSKRLYALFEIAYTGDLAKRLNG